MLFEKIAHIGTEPSVNVTKYIKKKLKEVVNSKEESTKARIKELINKGASLEVSKSIWIEDPEIEEMIVLTKFNELVKENQYTELERLMGNNLKINLLKTDINGEQCIETIIGEATIPEELLMQLVGKIDKTADLTEEEIERFSGFLELFVFFTIFFFGFQDCFIFSDLS